MANPLKLLKLKPQGFQFIEEIPIDAPPARTWKALLDFGGWFRFSSGPMSEQQIQLEPRIGGQVIREGPDGSGALHTTITYIEPEKLLRMSGPLGLTHLPVNNVFIWELQPRNDGKKTLLRFCQRSYGFMDDDVRKKYRQGWGELLPQLKALAENGSTNGQHKPRGKARKRVRRWQPA